METSQSTKIAVVGVGYVGLANAVLLAQKYSVTAMDVDGERVAMLRQKRSPIKDRDIESFLSGKPLKLSATASLEQAVESAEYVVVATPTSYDPKKNRFDTESVETVVEKTLRAAPDAAIVLRSTLPVGFTDDLRAKYPQNCIMVFPEFLREGSGLRDSLHPSRIIAGVGCENPKDREKAEEFCEMLKECAQQKDVPTLLTLPAEAEAIKLFSNTYLAMRVAFFNELDTYAFEHKLNAGRIVRGVSLDPRIGDFYNNPSFGYGGYCLPKDTKQLAASYHTIPCALISGAIESNNARKRYIAEKILALRPKTVGIYRLTMKSDSDNFRESSVLDIVTQLKENGVSLVLHEPSLSANDFLGVPVLHDLDRFKAQADIIVANRYDDDALGDVQNKVFTRDLYHKN